jgi:dihydroorotase-like cyclic amidohydrolase
MLTAVHDGRLSFDRLVELMSENPRSIFNLPKQAETVVEIDSEYTTTISDHRLITKCGWSPFSGMTVHGRVERVILRGQLVYEAGAVFAPPGTGRLLPDTALSR